MNGSPLQSAFADSAAVQDALARQHYLASPAISGTVHLAHALNKPLLLEGPAGTGKTELAVAVAAATDSRLIRLQCYPGIDEARALYEWDYRKQLLAIQSANTGQSVNNVFSEDFLLSRPLLDAVRATEPIVLLIDEVDQLDQEAEAFLLEFLSSFQVTVPELGTIVSTQTPKVFLTSNANRELSEALRRRCLFLHLDYPSAERERDIIAARLPGIDSNLAQRIAETVATLRDMEFRKKPSVSETLDWARALVLAGATDVTDEVLLEQSNVLLKHTSDIELLTNEVSAP